MAVRSFSGVRASEVNPSFLHANSTSHTWIFSAFAELIDNAYDPDVAATQLWIEKRMINGQVTLVFVDNGNGMNPDRLHKMLSFGFSDKQEIRGHRPIGQYGNGFKSGSMRLGKDVLVFTRQKGTMSVGFLSQTYLQSINAKTVFVPICTWRLPSNQMVQTQECYSSLKEILRHSIFRTERSIIQELDALGCIGHSGTEIIIYNLKRDRRGNLELDFESDPNDILNPQTLEMDRSMMFRPVAEPTPAFRRSLREYCSILYLKPRMKIMLRGEKVKTKLVSRSLSRTEKDIYKPHFLTRPVKIIFGFSPSKIEDYGILMYHKNRLIIAYEKVGYQKQANELGVGVVGVVELNFLEPIHNKQDFNKTTQYNSCVNALGVKLNEYWNEKTKGITPGNRLMGPGSRPPDWLWAQCDKCLKWRRLPPTISENQLPKKWFCHMNHDATRNRCDIPEESEEDDDMMMRPSYEKTYKKQMEERKRQQRFEQMRQMQNREKQLALKEEELKRMKMMAMQGGAANNTPGQPTPQANQPNTPQTTDAQPVDIDVKPDEADLMRAQQELTDAKRRETQQTKLIEELQQQKDMLEKKHRDVLKIAESITIKQIQDTERNGPNQSLEFGGVKRPLEGDNIEEGDGKRTRVVTSDGEVVYVVQGDQAPKPVIDLTLSDDEEQQAQAGENNQTSTNQTEPNSTQLGEQASEERDIKPDLDELDRRIAEAQRALGMVDDAAETEKTADSAGDTNPDRTASATSTTNEDAPSAGSEEGPSRDGNESAPSEGKDPLEGETPMETQVESNASDPKDKSSEPGETTEGESGHLMPKQEHLVEMEEDFPDDDFGGDFGEDDDDDFLRDLQTPEMPNLQTSQGSEESSKDGQSEEAKSSQNGSNGKGPEPDTENSAEKESVVENRNDTSPMECNTQEGTKETKSEDEKAKLESKADDNGLHTCKSEEIPKTEIKHMDNKISINEMKDEQKSALTNGDLSLAKAGNLELKPKMSKIVKTRGVQTLPVEIKGLLPESLNFSKLAPSEIHHLLVQRTNELEGLRKNIRELLRIILPEVDMGTPDCIDQVVQEVIRVNQVDSASQLENENTDEGADNTETSETAASSAVAATL